MARTSTLAALAALLTLTACGGSAVTSPAAARPSPGPKVAYLTSGGTQRTYVVFRPANLGPVQGVPLVIAMHGYTVDSAWMESTSHFDDLATQAGFVVAYPQGMGNAWNAGNCCGHDGNDDVGFIAALIEKLASTEHIDRKRVFATGMSNGGFMAQRLACELSDRITAVASVSGSLVADSCKPSRAISVLEMHGLDDDLVPYKGGVIGGLTYFPPTMMNMQSWAARDGCAQAASTTQNGLTSSYAWTSCRDGASVVLETVTGGGHSWFSPAEAPGEPDASQVVWTFF